MEPPTRPDGSPAAEGGATPVPPSTPLAQPVTSPFDPAGPEAAALPPTPTRQPQPPPPPAAGGRMGPFVILEEIDRGGMGVVYRARHERMGREVALKTLRGDSFADPQAHARFEREMRAAARLNHRHIVTIYEIGEEQGRPYYAMAYLPGGTLSRQRTRLHDDPPAALALMEKVARAIHYAHEQGVLHRDLKPGNVLLDEHGEPVVADFGLAKLREGDVELTQTGHAPGTPSYMAPEQAGGKARQVGPAADVWALGVMLFELLAGQRPFAAPSSRELLRKILKDRPAPLRSLRSELDPALEAIVARCLEKKPERRYASAEALADDLGRVLRREPPLARPARPPRWPGGWSRRRLLASLAAAACLLGLLAAGGIHLYLSGKAPAPILLLGDSGPPEAFRWLAGEKDAEVPASAPGEPFTVRSSRLGLLELRAAPPWDHFRLEAEVRQEESREGTVGIFLGHSTHPGPRGPHHCFVAVWFADCGDRIGNRNLSLCDCADFPGSVCSERPLARRLFPGAWVLPAGGVRPWRRIALDVTAGEVSAWGEGHPLSVVPRETLDDLRSRVLRTVTEDPGPFPVRGGLGLLVDRSIASFRRVILRPLP